MPNYRTATNPQTGEKLFLINGQWTKPMTATNPQTGEQKILVNNEWQDVGSHFKSGKRRFDIQDDGTSTELPVEEEEKKGFDIIKNIMPTSGLIDTDAAKAAPEVAATIGSGVAGEIAGGVAGAGALLAKQDIDKAGEILNLVRDKISFTPVTEVAKQKVGDIGNLANKIPDVIQASGDFVFEQTQSPAAATAAMVGATALTEFVGLKWLQRLKPGTRLLDNAGNPTKKLRKELDKQGLQYETLTPEARMQIPHEIKPGMLSTEKPKTIVEDALIEQIYSGGNDSSLAGLKVVNDRLATDKLANKAINQGFDPGDIQPIKNANRETKRRMLQMSKIMQSIKKNKRIALDINPVQVIGDSLGDRLTYIRDSVKKYSKELDNIAKEELPGTYIDKQPVLNVLSESLNDLNIEMRTPERGGAPIPNFEGSLIALDPSSQTAVKKLIKLMSEGGEPDALRFHHMKKQLDNAINYQKGSAIGLQDAGEKVLKKVRGELNNSLRNINQNYADVNDKLSSSLDAIQDLDKSVGTIDIFGDGSNKALGRKAMTLLSKNNSVEKINNAMSQLDEVASNLGGNFKDDIRMLVTFQDAMNKRFGAVEGTSFAGQIKEALLTADVPTSKADLARKVVTTVGEKAKGINDFNSFESINNLLMR